MPPITRGDRLNAVLHAKVGNATTKAVLFVLSDFVGSGTECWPSRATIADAANTSIDSVDRSIASLKQLGVLETVRRINEKGEQTSNLYRLNYAALCGPQPHDAATPAAPCAHPPPHDAPTPAADCGPILPIDPPNSDPPKGTNTAATRRSATPRPAAVETAGEPDDPEKPKRQRKPDPLFDAIKAEFFPTVNGSVPRSLGGRIKKCAVELAEFGAKPEDIAIRAQNHRLIWPNATKFGPESLVKHWPELEHAAGPTLYHEPAKARREAQAAREFPEGDKTMPIWRPPA